ncbi:MAG: hypothetical protein VX569_02835 [Pseudomonadota bacterium]|nr:hypothetical protein [Pseudomonadota bacterium]
MTQRPIPTALPFLLALAACGAPEPAREPADAGADSDAGAVDDIDRPAASPDSAPAEPVRDRDPARTGSIPLTASYVRGSWVAKGVEADCDRPDFQVRANRGGDHVIETSVNGIPATGRVALGEDPALRWDEGIPPLPIAARGPDGLAVMPSSGEREVTLAGQPINGDGVVFVKCG